jgi:hypothetical protein
MLKTFRETCYLFLCGGGADSTFSSPVTNWCDTTSREAIAGNRRRAKSPITATIITRTGAFANQSRHSLPRSDSERSSRCNFATAYNRTANQFSRAILSLEKALVSKASSKILNLGLKIYHKYCNKTLHNRSKISVKSLIL